MSIKFGRSNEFFRVEWTRKTLAALPKSARILDAGAGELRNKVYAAHLQYVSQDICVYDGGGDGSALQTGKWSTSGVDIISDIASIPEPDASFDAIICTEVFEHLPDPLLALKEFSRLLKPGGTLVITAPFCSLTHFAPYHYSSGFSRYWYGVHLRDYGFVVSELTPNGGWFDYLAQEIWRLPYMGSNYSERILGWSALLLAMPLMLLLRIMKIYDRGSSDLLTFGWHVLAKKASAD